MRSWGYDEAKPAYDHGALAADDQQLYVARFSHRSSGAEITAYDLASGEERWRTNLVALGPVADRHYHARVELRLAEPRLRAFGWETGGRYIEDVDVSSGRSLANVRVSDSGEVGPGLSIPAPADAVVAHPGAAAHVAFRFAGPRHPALPSKGITVQAGRTTCTFAFERDADRTHFACNDLAGNRLWGIDLSKQFVAGAALVADSDAVYVATYCAIATGTTLTAYAAATGRELWRTPLFGDGPVSHSKYSNDVSLRREGEHVVVSGWESAGKYVEVVDAKNGAILGNRAEP
jgi:outer membrane protein assembly factor BamB